MGTTTKTKERPILFNGEMVRAILDGRKTQTRRVMKDQPPVDIYYPGYPQFNAERKEWTFAIEPQISTWNGVVTTSRRCPYGQPGDRLWVRETWAALRMEFDLESGYCDGWEETTPDYVKKYRDDNSNHLFLDPPRYDIAYLDCYDNGADNVEERGFRWRPSIHMPRWASRIDLLVKDVRVERVQDISWEDAVSEGIPDIDPINDFHYLWDSINAKRGFGWDMNPWVWVVEFERIS